jgi:cytochrome c
MPSHLKLKIRLNLCTAIFFSAWFSACGNQPAPTKPVQPTIPRPAPAQFAQQKNCLACHNATGNMVGPSWQAVSAKYKSDPNATSTLTQKVLNGGQGSFGPAQMPAQANNLTPDEATYLVEWVLKGGQ